jgi:hypothetical protein
MPIDIEELNGGGGGDELATLKLEVGEKFVGTLVDIDAAPHYKFGTQEPEYQRDGKPKTKWVARLRLDNATDPATDLKWWTQNQVKYTLVEAVREHLHNYRGARIQVTRLPDGQPKVAGYKGPANYEVKLKPGPDGWVDPLAPKASVFDEEIEAPF